MYILAIDHGTTGIKACLFDKQGNIASHSYSSFHQLYPNPGWVEHNPNTLWNLTLPAAEHALKQIDATWENIEAIGLTNQRETTILWDAETSKPVYNAIVWQCRRTVHACEELRKKGYEPLIKEKTGLLLDPYFSATKIRWILDQLENKPKQLRFGTVDSWIIWKLSGNKTHVTDPSNASRTLLYNIHTKQWDPELLKLFDLSSEILPKVKSANFAYTDPSLTGGKSIPITAVAGDQQAALFGQKCWEAGSAKSTYGTGTFFIVNQGDNETASYEGLLTTLAYDKHGEICYALEGSIFVAGGILEWLRNALGIIETPQEADQLASSLSGNSGVYLVPAFVGLGAPHWNPESRALICGMTQGCNKAHIARAALEAMVYQTQEVIDRIKTPIKELRVDGGVTRSPFLIQFLTDQLNFPVIRSDDKDLTLKGVAYLAGLNSGFWKDSEEIRRLDEKTERFTPQMGESQRSENYQGWLKAVKLAL